MTLLTSHIPTTDIVNTTSDAPASESSHCDSGSLTDSYGLLIQGILAFLAFASLIVKRLLEPKQTRRPWLIWFFDTSKQATGAGCVHMLNVFLAPLLAHQDPCTWYFMSFVLDSTLGLLIIFIGIKLVSFVARLKGVKTLRFGEYGRPPQCRPWFHQCLAFIAITMFMKIVITVMLQFKFWVRVRRVILSPITNPKVEVTLVVLVVPFIMNTLMFWMVDSFTMHKVMLNAGISPSATGIKNQDLDDGADQRLLTSSGDDMDEDPFLRDRFRIN